MFGKYRLRTHNLLLIFLILILNSIGILILYSASNMDSSIVSRQILGSLVGFVICLVISFIDYNRLLKFSSYIYIGMLVLLILVLLLGVVHKGAGRWIVLPVIGQIQPAEFAKVGLILFFASFFEKNKAKLNEFKTLIVMAALVGVPMLLIFAEPNLSTTIIIAVIFAVMLCASGLSIKLIAFFSGTVGCLLWLVIYLFKTDNYHLIPFIKEYQKNRILGLLYPDQYSDTFFQQNNSIMAIGSGGFFGKGLNNTDIISVKAGNFLIEEDTDFIFAIIGEELGFRGCLGILFLYFAVILVILFIAAKSKNLAGTALCIGVAAWIGFQTFTNIAVATAIFPNTGVTLPFISRGISSLLALYIAVGLVLNVGYQTKE